MLNRIHRLYCNMVYSKAYNDHAAHHKHDYGDLISSIHFEEKVFEEIDNQHFVEGLAKYIRNEETQLLDSRKKRSDAFDKAKKIRQKRFEGLKLNPSQAILLVENAIELGYIWDFRLEEPWHPKIFLDKDRLTTFPYQHKYVVSYSGKPKHLFFHSEGKEYILREAPFEQFYNPRSILEQGRIRASSFHGNAEKGGNISHPRETEALDVAIFTSNLNSALSGPYGFSGAGVTDERGRGYEEDIIFEINCPSSFLIQHTSNDRWETTEELMSDFDNPSNYRDYLEENWNKTDEMDFKLSLKDEQSAGEAFLPLKYIQGVWDREIHPKTPHFIPLSDYCVLIKNKFPSKVPDLEKSHLNRVPDTSEVARKKKKKLEVKEELKELRKYSRHLHFLADSNINRIISDIENFEKHAKVVDMRLENERLSGKEARIQMQDYFEEDKESLIEHIENYNSRLNSMRSPKGNINLEIGEKNEVGLTTVCGNFKTDKSSWELSTLKNQTVSVSQKSVKEEKIVYERIHNNQKIDINSVTKQIEKEISTMLTELPIINARPEELYMIMTNSLEGYQINIREENLEKIAAG